MGKLALITTNFAGGELSPALAKGRVDIAKYNNGAAKIENCTIVLTGGAKRRPGSRFIAKAPSGTTNVRLAEFIYDRQQAYAMALFGNAVGMGCSIGFYRNRTPVMSGGSQVLVPTPYAAGAIWQVRFVQKADTAFFAHESYPPQRLQRYGDAQWAMVNVPWIQAPVEEQGHYPGLPLTLSATSVGAGRTGSTPGGAFLVSDVGRYIAYGGGYAKITARPNFDSIVLDILAPFPSATLPAGQWNLEGSPLGDICAANVGRPGQVVSLQATFEYAEDSKTVTSFIAGNGYAVVSVASHGYETGDTVRVVAGGTTITGVIARATPDVFTIAAPFYGPQLYATASGTAEKVTIVTGNELFRGEDVGKLVNLNGGIVRIDAVPSALLAYGTVLRTLSSDVPAGPNAWTMESEVWNGRKGYPRAVTISKQRLMFAGSPGYPQYLWASGIQEYLSFQYGTEDDAAFRFELDGPRNSPILHLAPARQLLVLTEADEMSVKGGNEKALGPTTVQKTDESTAGANFVRPVKVGNEMLFVQAGGRKVMAISYRYDIDGFASPDRTVFSSHVTQSGIRHLAHQSDPDSQLFAVRNDGQLAVCAYDVDQEAVGWSRWVTDGLYESACAVPTPTGQDVYTAVMRNLWDGSGFSNQYCIEVLDPDMLVDCGIAGYDAGGRATWGGLGHLEGKVVQCVADDSYMGTFTVAGGQITLPRPANSVQIGLGFTSTIEMLQPEAGGNGQTAQGSQVNVQEVVVRTIATRGLEINGKPVDPRRLGANLLDKPPPEFERDVRAITLQDEIYKAKVVITQSYPLPFHVLNVIRKVTVNDV